MGNCFSNKDDPPAKPDNQSETENPKTTESNNDKNHKHNTTDMDVENSAAGANKKSAVI